MRITICAYDAPNNIDGPTIWLKRLLPFLRSKGMNIRLLFLANNRKDLSAFQYFQEAGFECKLIASELFFEEQVLEVVKDLEEHTPDVFIPNYFPASIYAARWAGLAGIPSVVILHNDDLKHHLLVQEFASMSSPFHVDAVVGVSRSLENRLKNTVHGNVEYVTIPYGAPVPDVDLSKQDSETLKLVYMGRLNHEQKRIGDVTTGLCAVTKQIPGCEATIYGNGSALKDVHEILNAEAPHHVRYGGFVPAGEIQARLNENQVFVLLSEFEGIPIALMEAMACGLVPVVSDIKSGIAELIEHGVNGLIVQNRSDAFVDAIRYLRENPGQLKRMGAAARDTIVQGYSDMSANERWEQLLRSMQSRSGEKSEIPVPSIEELRSLKVHPKFLECETRVPSQMAKPLIRLVKMIGRLRRNRFHRP